ncbi:SPOR domain-containing protein [Crenobacter sp. SG2305]|uniref:SPOR domain-containing protein n=1 Tax=Crenobacter oryzisoli TaxID=3056844 RepID=UPI0025AA36E7|nr:SPOR domain-containing protein [Crenobacter sp. SG2305]MDN0082153.1 SPOR domain-containing protein [Crenobacter sp. SG2305]
MSNRDYKNTRSTRSRGASSKGGGGGGMMAGVLIGLIVGIGAAVGLAMYLNKSSTPFSNMEKFDRKGDASTATAKPEVLEPGTRITDQPAVAPQAKQEPTPAPATLPPAETVTPLPTPAPEPAPTPAAKPSHERAAKPVQPPAQAKNDDSSPDFDFYKILPGQVDAVPNNAKQNKSSEPSVSAPAKKTYLQLGAFQHENEADNLKAKLALLGIEAKIQSVNVPDKGLVHRVRVGPFGSSAEADRMRSQLKQSGIDASPVKSE